jgi:hypothetical protein
VTPYTHGPIVLPPRVDHRPLRSAREHQGSTNACSGHAISSAAELLLAAKGTPCEISEWAQWSLGRKESGTYPQDVGVALRVAVAASEKYGAIPLSLWTVDGAYSLPPDGVLAQAILPVQWEQTVGCDLTEIKTALAEGLPVVINFKAADDWWGLSGPMTTQRYGGCVLTTTPYSQHIVHVAGYDDTLGGLIVEDSYGDGVGEDGYKLFPYHACNDIFEAFALRQVGTARIPHYDDINDIVMGMTDEAFKDLLDGARADPKWADFLRYVDRAGGDRASAVALCKALRFTKMSDLTAWVQGA